MCTPRASEATSSGRADSRSIRTRTRRSPARRAIPAGSTTSFAARSTRTSLAPPTDSLTKIGEDGPVPRLLADLTPLKESQPFRRMWLGTSLSGIGTQLTNVAVALQVFDLTGSNLAVGLVG